MKIPLRPLAAAAVLLFVLEPMSFGQGPGSPPPGAKDIGGSWRMEQGSCIGNISVSAAANSTGAAWSGRYSGRCEGNTVMTAQYQISVNANGEYHFTGNPTWNGGMFTEEIVLSWTADGNALIGTGTESAQGKSKTVDVLMRR